MLSLYDFIRFINEFDVEKTEAYFQDNVIGFTEPLNESTKMSYYINCGGPNEKARYVIKILKFDGLGITAEEIESGVID